MTCGELLRRIAKQSVPNAEMQQHLAECSACRELLGLSLPEQMAAGPAPELLQKIAERMANNWWPVKPIPSNATFVILLLGASVIVACIAAGSLGMFALRALTLWQMLFYFGALLSCLAIAALLTVAQMVPGSKTLLNAPLTMAAVVIVLAGVVSFLFPNFQSRFIHGGELCFWNGAIVAAISGAAFAVVLRKMLPTSPVMAGSATGLLAGLCGVAMLSLHCPVLVSLHILVWHLSVLILAVLVGASIGLGAAWHSQKKILPYRNS